VLADVGSLPYNVTKTVHILAAIVAFAPAFVWPVLRVTMRKQGGGALPEAVARHLAPADVLVHGPALVVAGVFGVFNVLLSGEAFAFSDVWVSIAFVLWLLMLGVLFGGIVPAERKAAEPADTPGADARLGMFAGMFHLLIVLMLIDMIWQPGA